MSDITSNTTVCVFSFIERNTQFPLLNTTDISVVHESLYYSDNNDKEIFIGREIRIKDVDGKETKYKINDVIVHYYSGERFINRDLIGDKSAYNVQIMVYLEKNV